MIVAVTGLPLILCMNNGPYENNFLQLHENGSFLRQVVQIQIFLFLNNQRFSSFLWQDPHDTYYLKYNTW